MHSSEATTVGGLPEAGLGARLRRVRHVVLDMDGTIYSGGTLFPFTQSSLARLAELGIGFTLLTNNSSRSAADYVAHLQQLGLPILKEQVCTSTHSTIDFLRAEHPRIRRIFPLGTPSMIREIAAAGFTPTGDSAEDEPDAVLVGFDTGLTFARLCRAAYWIKQGKPFIASHVDRVCPTDQPTVLVDCGSVCAALTEATGRKPDAVLGKPNPRMLSGILQRNELSPNQVAIVGDRLYTDMTMAQRAGAVSVLVLTGEATKTEAARHVPALDLVVANLAHFSERLRACRQGEE